MITAAGRGQVCMPSADKNAQFKKIKASNPANQVCFDCPATRPTWASVTYGAYYFCLCVDCLFVLSIVLRRVSCCVACRVVSSLTLSRSFWCLVMCRWIRVGCIVECIVCILDYRHALLQLCSLPTLLLNEIKHNHMCIVSSYNIHTIHTSRTYTGIFLCLDCSAQHRSMGVHTTFVRSVDLDEWTLRQVDAMRLGGNAAARTFFRAHGTTELQGKIDKKYTAKAAQLYKVELLKKVEAAAVQRGEGGAVAAVPLAGLSLSSDDDQAVARQKVSAARMSQPVQAKATLASQLPGASKLTTPPSSGGLVLRKPAGAASKNYFKKKSSGGGGLGGGASKLRANKLSMAKPGGDTKGEDADDDLNDFDKVVEEPAAPVVEAPPPTPSPVVPPEPTPSPQTEAKQKISMDEGVARMKMMNSDFFGGI